MKRDQLYYRHCKSVLYQTALFNGLAEDILDDMLSLFRRDTWRRGAQLNTEIFQRRFYLLIDGRVEIIRVNPTNRQKYYAGTTGAG